MALQQHGVRRATWPGTPESWSYPRRLAWSRAHRTPRRCCRFVVPPWGDALQGVPSRRPRGPAVARVVPRPSLPPATRAPHTRDAGLCSRWVPTQRAHARLRRRPRPAECSSPLAERLAEAVGVCRLLTGPHPIVGVSEPAGLASTAARAPRRAPPISGLGPVPRRAARGADPPWWGPRPRMSPLAVGVQPPGVAPRLDPPSPRLVIAALRQHPAHPRVMAVVADAWALRVSHPVVSPTVARDRPVVHRVHRAPGWPLPLTTPPALRRVAGGEAARDRPRPPCIRDGRDPHRSPLAMLGGDRVPSDQVGEVTRPLPARHPWPAVRAPVRRVRWRAHRIAAVGGLVAEITPAVRPPCRVEPPSEVAPPILRVACGLLGSTLPGGVPGVSEPSCPVPVACAGAVCLSAPAPCGRRARPPRPLGGSDSLEAVGCPVSLRSASRRARAAARSTPLRLRPTSGSGVPRLWRLSRLPGARVPRLGLDRPGPSQASHVLDASLHAYHARRGPRPTQRARTHASPLGRLLGRSYPRPRPAARSRGGLTRWGVRSPRRSPGFPGSASPGSFDFLPRLHRGHTRHAWLVRPDSAGTFTLPEAPSFAWCTNARPELLLKAGATEERTLEAVSSRPLFGLGMGRSPRPAS